MSLKLIVCSCGSSGDKSRLALKQEFGGRKYVMLVSTANLWSILDEERVGGRALAFSSSWGSGVVLNNSLELVFLAHTVYNAWIQYQKFTCMEDQG